MKTSGNASLPPWGELEGGLKVKSKNKNIKNTAGGGLWSTTNVSAPSVRV